MGLSIFYVVIFVYRGKKSIQYFYFLLGKSCGEIFEKALKCFNGTIGHTNNILKRSDTLAIDILWADVLESAGQLVDIVK